jgi:molybdopterin converting factor small subunit
LALQGFFQSLIAKYLRANNRNVLNNQEVGISRNFNQYLESGEMTVTVSIPTILRSYTGNAKTVECSGESIAKLISCLDGNHPGIGARLLDEGQLRRFVNIYINDEDIRFMGSLDAKLSDGDAVTILPAVAGG